MVWTVLRSFCLLFIVQIVTGNDLPSFETEGEIQQWVGEKIVAILDSHKPLQDAILKLGAEVECLTNNGTSEVMRNVSKQNVGLCSQGVEMNLMGAGQGLQCIANVASKGAVKQIETQMHCFQVMEKYSERIIGIGARLMRCSGAPACMQDIIESSAKDEIENHELVTQKLNHVWEFMHSMNEMKQKCAQQLNDTANSALASCRSLSRTKRSFAVESTSEYPEVSNWTTPTTSYEGLPDNQTATPWNGTASGYPAVSPDYSYTPQSHNQDTTPSYGMAAGYPGVTPDYSDTPQSPPWDFQPRCCPCRPNRRGPPSRNYWGPQTYGNPGNIPQPGWSQWAPPPIPPPFIHWHQPPPSFIPPPSNGTDDDTEDMMKFQNHEERNSFVSQ